MARQRAAGVQGQHSDWARLEGPREQEGFQSMQEREAEGGKANHELRSYILKVVSQSKFSIKLLRIIGI